LSASDVTFACELPAIEATIVENWFRNWFPKMFTTPIAAIATSATTMI
jgi:hypothetical protein